MKLSKQNLKQMKKWIDALRSGEYSQGKYSLQTNEGFCCLGVACKVLIPKSKQLIDFNDSLLHGATPSSQGFAPTWLGHINGDFETKTGGSLSTLNDIDDFTFEEISDLLQAVYIEKVLD